MMKQKIRVKGMHCKSCETLIADSLEEMGVKAKADHKKGEVEVTYDESKVSINSIKTAIAKEGYKVE